MSAKIQVSQRLAEQLNESWTDPDKALDAMVKASDEDRSQIIRMTLVSAFALPWVTAQQQEVLKRTLAQLKEAK